MQLVHNQERMQHFLQRMYGHLNCATTNQLLHRKFLLINLHCLLIIKYLTLIY